jgi:CheY-like chemotaxis protein
MPFMSGVEVARAVRALPSDLYIVGCTGNALREDQDEYLAAGADAIITKPISQTAILTQIQCARERRTAGSRVPHPLPVPK